MFKKNKIIILMIAAALLAFFWYWNGPGYEEPTIGSPSCDSVCEEDFGDDYDGYNQCVIDSCGWDPRIPFPIG